MVTGGRRSAASARRENSGTRTGGSLPRTAKPCHREIGNAGQAGGAEQEGGERDGRHCLDLPHCAKLWQKGTVPQRWGAIKRLLRR